MHDIGISTITVNEIDLSEIRNGTLTIIDVREDYEWEAGHIEGAVHIPLDEIPQRYGELNPDNRNLVICRVGGRSGKASEWLNSHGYDAVNIIGGMDAWIEDEKPIISDSGTPAVL